MKVALILLSLVCAGISAPQPRRLFHEHFDDFMNIIISDAGHDIEHLMSHYLEHEEFVISVEYIRTNSFRDLIYEMEGLPEFQAVVDFLENDHIDIHYFIDLINEMIVNIDAETRAKGSRQESHEHNFRSFVQASIALFPRERLAALYDEKITEDEEFRNAMQNLQSDEWLSVLNNLFESEAFQNEAQVLAEHGIYIQDILQEIVAIFGQ